MNFSQAYGFGQIKPLSNDELFRKAPSIFSVAPSPKTSNRYRYIPTVEVVDGLRKADWLPVLAQEGTTRKDHLKGFAHHLIRFRHAKDLFKKEVGDVVPEIVVTNSHNGTSCFKIHSGLYRFVCGNGMIVADSTLASHKIRHSGKMVDDAINASFTILEETPKMLKKVEDFRSIILNEEEQTILAESAIALRFPQGEAQRPTFAPEQALHVLRGQDRGNDLWTTFNRIQEHVINGGMRGLSESEKGRYTLRDATDGLRYKKTTARAVTSTKENVRLNTSLWSLAEKMAV